MVLDANTNEYGVGMVVNLTSGTEPDDSNNCIITGLTLLRGNEVSLNPGGFVIANSARIEITVSNQEGE